MVLTSSLGRFLPLTVAVFIIITSYYPLLVDSGEVYCIGGCDNGDYNLLYEDICCDPYNLGDVVRLPSTENSFRQKYIYCPSVLPIGCSEYVSCADILSHNPSAVSGYYNITLNNGSSVSVYCDMEGVNCNGEGGWTRVGYINASDGCPYGWYTYTTSNNITYCYKFVSGIYYDITKTLMEFSTFDIKYSQVCGEARGSLLFGDLTMYFAVADHSQQHIWTFALGSSENGTSSRDCPCNNGSQGSSSVLFNETYVGNDYYCESGFDGGLEDLLWDGEGCYGRESTCCTNPMIPWFVKTLNGPTTDNIEWTLLLNNQPNYLYTYYLVNTLEILIK